MLVKHAHPPGRFDPGHCRNCARKADLLDHYWRVQREEQAFREAHWWARRAYRQASWALSRWTRSRSFLPDQRPRRARTLRRSKPYRRMTTLAATRR
jgi:hypothetical protein